MTLPHRLQRNSGRAQGARECAAHRRWVRGHACSVKGCERRDIEAAHVRRGADGGTGLKPADRWCISLCHDHHAEQHRVGEATFARTHDINLHGLAQEFAARSPHRSNLA